MSLEIVRRKKYVQFYTCLMKLLLYFLFLENIVEIEVTFKHLPAGNVFNIHDSSWNFYCTFTISRVF